MSMTTRLEGMLEKGRDDAMLRFGLGSAYFNEKAWEPAIKHLEACIGHDAQYSAAYKLLGKAYLKADDSENARRIFSLGLPIAEAQGDKQSIKEMQVFMNKLNKN